MYDYEYSYDSISLEHNLDEDYLDELDPDEEYRRETLDLVELAYAHYA